MKMFLWCFLLALFYSVFSFTSGVWIPRKNAFPPVWSFRFGTTTHSTLTTSSVLHYNILTNTLFPNLLQCPRNSGSISRLASRCSLKQAVVHWSKPLFICFVYWSKFSKCLFLYLWGLVLAFKRWIVSTIGRRCLYSMSSPCSVGGLCLVKLKQRERKIRQSW